MKKKPAFTTYQIVFIPVMAAIIYVVTNFRFPLLGSKVHFANSMCLLSGLLFGPVCGGLAAGIGSALYDAGPGGYSIIECAITFFSKFLMAAICALIAGRAKEEGGAVEKFRMTAACVIGALSYVALYMLKTFVFQRFVYGFPADAVWATVLGKLPASLINAVFAMVVTPVLYSALVTALRGMLGKIRRV
ncbi:MAG: ECF transporter S component [Butyricicoccus sp.]|nr:ECF transporter S component [Butyricicoccus sp.]